MPRQIHIHIHRGRTADAFEESKVKRDAGGKFATTGAGSHGDHEHHFEQGEHHAREAQKMAGKNPAAAKAHEDASNAHHNASEHLKAAMSGRAGSMQTAQKFANEANSHAAKALAARGGAGYLMPKAVVKASDPDGELVSVKMHGGSGSEKQYAIPKPPAGTPGGPQPGRGPVDLGTQRGPTASRAGAGTETHHSKLEQGHHLYDKHGQKIDEVESIGRAMHSAERTIHTRAGYQHVTRGGHLPDGMHAKAPILSARPQHPLSFKHEGVTYHKTGKEGTHNATGVPSAEYVAYDKNGNETGQRVWRRTTGHIDQD